MTIEDIDGIVVEITDGVEAEVVVVVREPEVREGSTGIVAEVVGIVGIVKVLEGSVEKDDDEGNDEVSIIPEL